MDYSKREKVFLAIQNGANPLSNAEIATLAEKHPGTWAEFIGRGVDNESCDDCGEPATHERYDGHGPTEHACDECAVDYATWTAISFEDC